MRYSNWSGLSSGLYEKSKLNSSILRPFCIGKVAGDSGSCADVCTAGSDDCAGGGNTGEVNRCSCRCLCRRFCCCEVINGDAGSWGDAGCAGVCVGGAGSGTVGADGCAGGSNTGEVNRCSCRRSCRRFCCCLWSCCHLFLRLISGRL